MTDSIDKNSKEKRDNPDVDLDGTLGETSFSALPMNEFEDDDAIDRLLMNTGFDEDDPLIQAETHKSVPVMKDDDLYDELDDFLSFDGFGDDLDEPEKNIEELEQTVESPSLTSLTQSQDDEDAIDRLLIDSGFDADDVSKSANVGIDDLDDFLGLSDDLDESNMTRGEEVVASPPVVSDEIDDFSSFRDDFDKLDMVQDEKISDATPAVVDLSESSAIEELKGEMDAGALEELNNFSDFSDFNEPESELVSFDKSVAVMADLTAAAEVDDSDMEEDAGVGLAAESNDFDESDMIQGAGVEVEAPKLDDEQQTVSDDDLQDDENGFNKPFEDAGSDAEDLFGQTIGEKDEFGDTADSNDFSTQTKEIQLDKTDEPLPRDDDFLLPDFDITADSEDFDLGSDAGAEDGLIDPFEPEDVGVSLEDEEAVVELKPKQVDDAVVEKIENVKLTSSGLEQQDIAKQLKDAEIKVKKAKLFNYLALGFGAVSLGAASLLGVITYSAKTEVSKLAETVATLQQSLEKVAASNPNVEIEAMRSSIVLLNQQVNGFITDLKGSPQFPVDALNNKVPDIAAKQEIVSKALDVLQVKMGGKVASEPPVVAEPPKVEAAHEPASVKEEHTHELHPVKPEAEHEHSAPKEVVAHEHVPSKERAIHDTIPAKTETAHETATAKVKVQPEATKPEVIKAKPITIEKAVVKLAPVKEKKQEAPGKWGVNLVAFKQEWFAKSKAAEFAQQGIYAEVIPVHEKNTTMYRLRVGGFKSKKEAYSNTDKIKKLLNLDSVWVSDN